MAQATAHSVLIGFFKSFVKAQAESAIQRRFFVFFNMIGIWSAVAAATEVPAGDAPAKDAISAAPQKLSGATDHGSAAARQLIAALGADGFETRAQAQNALMHLGRAAIEPLEIASKGDEVLRFACVPEKF